MSSFFSAVVNLSSSKSCFVTLSADLAQRLPNTAQSSGKVVVLLVQWPAGLAFVSWSGEIAINRSVGFGQVQSSTVEISRKFADLNEIQNGDQVVLVPVDSAPSCARLHVDPFTANDWEILELHASFIESNLLNQVRVVWTGQVVPVWINKNTCIAIRVGETEPKASCVVLEEFTEVIIAPKQRNVPASKPSENPHSMPSQTKQENTSSSLEQHNHDNQYKSSKLNSNDTNCVIKNMTEETYASKLYNLWNSFLYGVDRNHEETSQQESRNTVQCSNLGSASQGGNAVENGLRNNTERNCCRSVFGKAKLELCLRSLPEVTSKPSSLQAIQNRTIKMSCVQPSTVFVNPNSVCFSSRLECEKSHLLIFPNDYEGFQKIVTIKRLLSPKEKIEVMESGKRKNEKGSEPIETHTEKMEYLTKSVVVKMVLNKDVFPGQIWMHRLLKQQLGTRGISCFLVHDVTAEPDEIQGIILHSDRETIKMSKSLGHEVVIKAFNDWVVTEASSETCPLIVWDGLEVTFSCNGNCFEFLVTVLSHNNTEQKPYFKLTPSTLDRIKVVIGDVKHLSKTTNELLQLNTANTAELSCSINDLGGFSQSFHKCLSHLFVSLGKSSLSAYLCGSLASGLSNGAVLIHGSGIHVGEGCGKTSLAHALCHELQRSPICAYVIIIDCITLRAKRVEIIQRQWQQAFKEAAWHQPSVILLDNLDHVISAPNMAQEMGSEGLYRIRLVQVFKDLVATEVLNKSRIALIATSRSQNSLHAALQTGHGSHIFQCQVELGPLNEKQRVEVLQILIKTKFPEVNQVDLDTVIRFVAKKCQGFSPNDLSSLADRALHFSHVRKMECTLSGQTLPVLVPDDFDKAFSGFSPASLHGVQLHKPGELSWADVGGLRTVKKSLEETLLWPTKYSDLFSKCPLRLRSGLLLYGPPGTGKTLLAGVVAKETGLNFISIKGPELLSKYIGASEQAVRDIFTRAQTAKPCILFFDEFDSLAPRRGHDSTGVTDRVVNQLLTQLDGVEGLEGVYILAATSRPGLIDPALLRPGRLDKCVYCPIPNQTERLEILQALSRNLSLADDVKMKELADKCEHFTGADLKALLYNAQLESIHRSTSKLKLYGDILESRDEIKTSVKASKENTEEDKGILVFTTGKGKRPLSKEEEETIQAEANILQQNLYQKDLAQTQVHSDKESANEKGVLCICQSDLDKAALITRPSVLPKDQLQYENIYDSFVKSRGGSFTKNTPMQEKATLA